MTQTSSVTAPAQGRSGVAPPGKLRSRREAAGPSSDARGTTDPESRSPAGGAGLPALEAPPRRGRTLRRLLLFPSAAGALGDPKPRLLLLAAAAQPRAPEPAPPGPGPRPRGAMLLLVATFFMAFVLLLYMLSPLISPKPLALPGAHVVVSGLRWLRRHLPGALGCPETAPCRAGPRPGRRPPFLQMEGHLLAPTPALSLRRVLGTPCRRVGSSRAWRAGGTAPASLVPTLQGLRSRSVIPRASLGCGRFCPQFPR